jgi:hypothetical protein
VNLGGWWRLWIAMSLVYGIAIGAIAFTSWPNLSSIAHHPSFDYRLPPPAAAVLNRPVKKDAQGWEDAPILLEMPNRHQFHVAGDTPKEASALLKREYVGILELERTTQIHDLLFKSLLMWIIPVMKLSAHSAGCPLSAGRVQAGRLMTSNLSVNADAQVRQRAPRAPGLRRRLLSR